MLPFVSVILPVRNERAMLPRLLDDLLRQNYPTDRYEILVVDSGSSDGTPDLVRRRYAKAQVPVRVIDNPIERRGAGRNAGIRAASGDIMLFVDGHCRVPSRNLLEDSVAILEHTGADCLCQPQPLLVLAATETGEVIARASTCWMSHDSLIHKAEGAGFAEPSPSGATYRRGVFERVGLYDESFDACEDIEFNRRVSKSGMRAYTDPRLAVHYQPQATLRDLLGEMVRLGRGRMRLVRRHGGSPSLSHLAPVVLLISLLLAIPAWIFLPFWAAAILTLPLAAFAIAASAASLELGMRHGVHYAMTAPAVFAAMHFGQGAGFLIEALHPGTPIQNASRPELVRRPQPAEAREESDRAA